MKLTIHGLSAEARDNISKALQDRGDTAHFYTHRGQPGTEGCTWGVTVEGAYDCNVLIDVLRDENSGAELPRMTIDELEQHPIYGNGHDDLPLWDACGNIVMDKTKPMDERIRALRVIDRITGAPGAIVTEEDVQQYVEFINSMGGIRDN